MFTDKDLYAASGSRNPRINQRLEARVTESQTSELARLREENAALRKALAEGCAGLAAIVRYCDGNAHTMAKEAYEQAYAALERGGDE